MGNPLQRRWRADFRIRSRVDLDEPVGLVAGIKLELDTDEAAIVERAKQAALKSATCGAPTLT